MKRTPIAAALLSMAMLAACSSGSTQTSSTPASSPGTSAAAPQTPHSSGPAGASSSVPAKAAMITIKNFAYTVSGHVTPGQKVTVCNNDGEAHTVTADTGSAFDVTVPASSTATLTAPTKAGTYEFHCTYHSNMHGSLTVG